MIIIYGKKGCAKCTAAKDKMRVLDLVYEFVDLELPPENWRDLGCADALAWLQLNGDLPLIRLEPDGPAYSYPEAMRRLREEINAQKKD